jgi:hypothetical protein
MEIKPELEDEEQLRSVLEKYGTVQFVGFKFRCVLWIEKTIVVSGNRQQSSRMALLSLHNKIESEMLKAVNICEERLRITLK